MKIKISRIWGVVLVLVMLAALLVPAVPASAGNMVWTKVTTPGSSSSSSTVVTGIGSWLMDVAADGKTIFAYDNTSLKLYKSTNGGLSFSTSAIGTSLNTNTLVALVVSSDYANDSTVVAATTSTVYRSINGGSSFFALGSVPIAGIITSLDAGAYYKGGSAILAGVSSGSTTPSGGVAVFVVNEGSWTNLNIASANALPGAKDVYAVAFSPNHRNDAEILVVSADATSTYLETKLGTNNFNADLVRATIAAKAAGASNWAVMTLPADYDWSGNNKVLVGLGTKGSVATAPAAADDVYRVSLGFAGPGSSASDLNATSTTAPTNVYSLSFKGNLADGALYVGQQDNTTVKKATGVGGSSVSFNNSSRPPTGSYNTIVRASKVAADANVFAITSGAGSALAVSTDAGVNFNLISLVSFTGAVTFSDLEVVDANIMYLLLKDDTTLNTILYKTTDAGATWQGIFTQSTAGQQMLKIYKSPAYATDKTIYVTQNDSRIWKSSNEGVSFIGLSSPNSGTISAFAPVDATSYFVATSSNTAGLYKAFSFVAASGVSSGTITSIVYVDATTLFVGTNTGSVYMSTNNGTSFSAVGSSAVFGAGDLMLWADVAYATNKIIYGANASGIKKFTVGGSNLDWSSNASTATGITDIVQGAGGGDAIYATTTVNTTGAFRNVNPASPGPQAYEAMATASVQGFPGGATWSPQVLATGTVQVPNNTLYLIIDGAPDTVYTVQDTAIAAPAVTAPAANAKVATNTTFSWLPVTIPAGISVKYDVQVAYDSGFNGLVINATATGTGVVSGTLLVPSSLGITLEQGRNYWWRVRVASGSPLQSKYSATTAFSVELAQASPNLNLLAPLPGATDVPRMPVLQWAAVLGAQSYDLQVADNPVFVNPIDSQTGLNTTVWTLTKQLDYGKTYYWRMRAVASTGNVSEWIAGAFTVMNAPPPPTTPPGTTIAPPPVTPTVTVIIPPAATPTITITQQPAEPLPTPAYIWVIIVIGAILVIAVIVLIARTRRV